jgi:SecD/SecF fusion protein
MRFFNTRAVIYLLLIVLGLSSALPNLLSETTQKNLPAWFTQNTLRLGLDLQGGSHLLMSADTAPLIEGALERASEQLLAQFQENQIAYTKPQTEGTSWQLSLRDPTKRDKAKALATAQSRTAEGVRMFNVSATENILRISLRDEYIAQITKDALDRSLEVVRRRLNETGLVEPSISKQGEDGILIQMPGVSDPAYIRQLLGTTAQMSFHWVARSQTSTPTIKVLSSKDKQAYTLEKRVAMKGEHISDASLGFHQNTGEPVVTFALDNEGAKLFGEMTRRNIGRALAIVLDNEVITAPVIQAVIGSGRGEITGNFSSSEASDLALLLRAGALPTPLSVVEERTVGPDLGSDAIQMGLFTGIFGAALVLVFMTIIYRGWGLIACTSLSINIGLIFGILSLFKATLTLPGIAGIILTIGMAVDANILINERIREETARGKRAMAAINAGFDKAYATIIDANVTTLIAVGLLFMFGNGPIRGFAVTIAIGLMTSMFASIAVTRVLIKWHIRNRQREVLTFSGFTLLDRLSNRKTDFLRGRFLGLTLSAILSLTSVGLFFGVGLNYGVDFTGGTLVNVKTEQLSVQGMRNNLLAHDFNRATIQEFGDDGQYLVRLPAHDSSKQLNANEIDLLKKSILSEDPTATFPRVDMVGPKISGGFADASILAVLLAAAGMLIYLWLRYESHFATAAIATIGLDITKTIGFFALTGLEFNLTAIAALLALIGYSINDKVVVFDRVREGLRADPTASLIDVLNESISATLTRTLFTSATTLLAILPMAIAGGDAVSSFAKPMLFGIIVGTSSSIFIASPILYFLGEWRERKGLKQLRPSAEEIRASLAHIP